MIWGILVGDSHASAVATVIQSALPGPERGLLTFTYTTCQTIFAIKKRERGISGAPSSTNGSCKRSRPYPPRCP